MDFVLNGSTCPGCDGVTGSGAVLDACRVCGGKVTPVLDVTVRGHHLSKSLRSVSNFH